LVEYLPIFFFVAIKLLLFVFFKEEEEKEKEEREDSRRFKSRLDRGEEGDIITFFLSLFLSLVEIFFPKRSERERVSTRSYEREDRARFICAVCPSVTMCTFVFREM